MAKTNKKNPGKMMITNPDGKKKPKSRGLLERTFGSLAKEGKDAGIILLGRYAGEVSSTLGQRYLAGTAGKFAVPAGQLAGWYALKKFVKGPWARFLRLGLLSEAIHGLAVRQGLNVPAKMLALIPAAKTKAPPPTEPPPPGTEGLGLLGRRPAYSRVNPYHN